jgi:acyl-coenzyme A synthetase/AMP-(fatty) acid ligase/surfactin synthase thioesterase subunit/acyl carrier protein
MIFTKFQRAIFDVLKKYDHFDSVKIELKGAPFSESHLNKVLENINFSNVILFASKYSCYPEIEYCSNSNKNSESTINTEWISKNILIFNYNPIFWNLSSIFKIIDVAKNNAIENIPPYQALLGLEKGIYWSEQTYTKPAEVSPKIYSSNESGAFSYTMELTVTESNPLTLIKKYLESTLIFSSSCIELIDAASGNNSVIGNSSYPIYRNNVIDAFDTFDIKNDLGGQYYELGGRGESNYLILEKIVAGIGIKRFEVQKKSFNSGIELRVVESDQSILINVHYNRRLFSLSESQSHFADLQLFLNGEKEQGLSFEQDGGIHEKSPCASIRTKTRETLSCHKTKIALKSQSEELSYGDLHELAGKVAAMFDETDTLIALLLEPSVEFTATVVACLASDITFVPIDPTFGEERIKTFINEIKPDKVVASFGNKVVLDTPVDVIGISLDRLRSQKSCNLKFLERPCRPIYRIYTSGSTGTPKGIDISDANLTALFESYQARYPDIFTRTWPLISSVSFDAAVKQYIGPLAYGGKIFIPASRLSDDPIAVIRALESDSIDILNATPTMINFLLDSSADLSGFHNIFLGGELLRQNLIDRLRKSAPSALISNLYGPSETTINALSYDVDPDIQFSIVPIGRALKGCSADIVLKNNCAQPLIGSKGILQISGSLVAGGYVNVPSDSFYESNGENVYSTGDICFKWHDDFFYFLGREDNQVKVKGIRVDLGEIESLVQKKFPLVSCYSFKNKQSILVVLHNCSEEFLEPVREWALSGSFGSLPLRICHVHSLPLTVNGKVNVAELIAETEIKSNETYSPENMLEAELLIQANVILARHNLPKISPITDLIEQGMDSLATMELMVFLSEQYEGKIGTNDFLEARTLRNIARRIYSGGEKSLVRWSCEGNQKENLAVLLPPVLGKGIIFSEFLSSINEHCDIAICDYPDDRNLTTVEDIAKKIFTTISENLQGRNLIIVGFSMGASVGYVLTSMFETQGKAPERFIILDKAPVANIQYEEQLSNNRKFLSELLRDINKESHFFQSMLEQVENNTRIGIKFEPRGFIDTPVTIYSCRDSDALEFREWSKYLRSEIAISEINCTHNFIFSSGNYESIATEIVNICSDNKSMVVDCA